MSEIQFDLRELQLRLSEMLSAVAKVCDENNIRYYLIGGTALGAIRHKGFIPWDDDIDVAMPRPDYERFLKISHLNLPEHYEVRNYKTHPEGHVYPWSKIENKRTTVVMNWHKYLNYAGGIYIDLFPLDGLPKNDFLRKVHLNTLFFFSKKIFGIAYVDPETFEGRFLKRWIVKFFHRKNCRSILHFLIHSLLGLYHYDRCEWVANCLGEYGFKEVMEKSIFGNFVNKEFEGSMYKIPEQYDLYLTRLYGNYVELPPADRRYSLHDFYVLNLSEPNESYINKK
ncbi:LicD family protein [Bacteroides sp. GD17]|jgi:lipopolysaccharide cholinephosphotransferase|uniref:LicD family protein n=1 Tax=Bacteroides sp. GD17 TaxID=3139826 RepID=UPI00313B2B23